MTRIFGAIVVGAVALLVVSVSSAQMGRGAGGGMGMGSGMMGGGSMGSGMMGGDGGQGTIPDMTAEQAQQAASDYASQYLPGYIVQRTVPLTGMHMTMYQAELSGPAGETRILHVNPWGNVMPFGASTTR